MQIIILASGSAGNATLVKCGDNSILIDAGITLRDLTALFKKYGQPSAVFCSHSHSDHIKSCGALGRKFKMPIYLHSATYEKKQKIFNNCPVHFIDPGIKNPVKLFNDRLEISSFSTQHDCEASLGFIVKDLQENKKICYLTDTGSFTKLMYEAAKDCDGYLLETDYDDEELEKTAEYDDILKDRIRSDFGHLSNKQAINFCKRLDFTKLKFISFIHLSKVTNSHEIVQGLIDSNFPNHKEKFFIEPIEQKLEI